MERDAIINSKGMILFATAHDPTLNPQVLKKRRGEDSGDTQVNFTQWRAGDGARRQGHLSRMLKALGSISRTKNQMKTVTKKAMCISTQEILLNFWKLQTLQAIASVSKV